MMHARSQRRSTLLAVLMLTACAAPAHGQFPLDRPAILQQQRAQREAQYRSAANMVAGMQPMRVERAEELVALRLEGPHLVGSSPLLDDPARRGRQYRIELASFKGPTYATVSAAPVNGPLRGRGPPALFELVEEVFTLQSHELGDGGDLLLLRVTVTPQALAIEHTTQFTEGNRILGLACQRPGDGRAGQVRLSLNEYGPAFANGGAGPPANLQLAEADFDAFARTYPRETDAYVRPLLRQLGQEAALAPDPLMAWQVLGYPDAPDPRTARAVEALLPRLDDPDYRRRDAALAELMAMGRPASAVLLRMDRAGFSVERNLRLDRALAPFSRLAGPEIRRMRSDKSFLLDCLMSPEGSVRSAGLARLRHLTGGEVAFDTSAADAARGAAVLTLRERLLGGGPASRPAGK